MPCAYDRADRGRIAEMEFSALRDAAKRGDAAALRNNDWMVLGPFVYETGGAFETEYLYQRDKILEIDYLETDGGEAGIVPELGTKCRNPYLGGGEPVWEPGYNKWDTLRFVSPDTDEACNPALFLTDQRNCVFYAAVYVNCDRPEKAVVCYENSGCRLFLNGRLISDEPYGRVKGMATMGHAIPVEFSAGRNLLLFKLRPGYICDTMDFSMSNCSIYPIAAASGALGATYPAATAVYTKPGGRECRVWPFFAAAFEDSPGGGFSAESGFEANIPPMRAGETRLIRSELPVSGGDIGVCLLEEGAGPGEGVFHAPPGAFPAYDGEELVFSSFHFDTTYHQEQSVYALGAMDIMRNILSYMRADGSFKAIISEVDYLHPYYSVYPEDRDYLKQMFSEGRAEADCFYNQPNEMTSSPEGLVRNMLYGQLYHRDVLGRICDVYYPGDVFGHFNQMSQFCRKGGCNAVGWDKHIFGFLPAFRHVSPDGSSLIHKRGWITQGSAKAMGLSVCEGSGRAVSTVPGYPLDADTGWMESTSPKARFAVFSEYRKGLLADEERALAESGRSPFELSSRDMSLYHAGVSLTRTDFKQANRLAENLLITAEKLCVIACLYGADYPEKALDKAWRQILCGQHHDSITGTNNEISFVDLMAQYREACELSAQIVQSAADYIAGGIRFLAQGEPLVVFNPHSWEREEVCDSAVALDFDPACAAVYDSGGNPVQFRFYGASQSGGKFTARLEFFAKVPALGYAAYYLRKTPEPAAAQDIAGDENTIENEFYRLTADPDSGGGIISIWDKENGRELIDTEIDGPANRIIALKEIHDRMETQHEFYTNGHRLGSETARARVSAERAGLRQRLTVRYSLGSLARITQEISLSRGSRRIDFQTRIDDYAEEDDLFAVTFPVSIKGAKPTFDDRFAPQVRNESKNALDFRTHQYAMFSHCAVYAANQWMDYGPSVTLGLSAGTDFGSINLGMTQIIREPAAGLDPVCDRLLAALTKKAVPVTVFSDKKQSPMGSRIIHFNEDLASDTRFVLSVSGDGNEYAGKLLANIPEKLRSDFEGALKRDGFAVLYGVDRDNLWSKGIDTLLVMAEDAAGLESFVSRLETALAGGRWAELSCLAAGALSRADEYGVALINTGNIACSVERGPMLCMMLFHTAEFYGSNGKTNGGTELVPEQKGHIFTYSLLPHKGDWREAGVYRRGLEKNDPLFCAAPSARSENAFLPEEKGFVRSGAGVVLTALKAGGAPLAGMKGEYGGIFDRGVTLRCFEPDGVSARENIELGFDISSAFATDLLEEGREPAEFTKNTLSVPAGAYSIETFRLMPEKPGMALPAAVLGPEREAVEPTYIRSWEHDLGSMPFGYLSLCAVIGRKSREPDGLHIETEISVANNHTDIPASGTLSLVLPEGWSVEHPPLRYSLAPGAHCVFPLTVTRPAPDAKGVVRLEYSHDGQVFTDIFEAGAHVPELSLAMEGDIITAAVKNPTGCELIGELYLTSPIETWGLPGAPGNPFAAADISPRVAGISVPAGETKEYIFTVSGDEKLAFWAVAKLCVNGRIRFASVHRRGPRHAIWAHTMVSDFYADGGSLRKLLEL